MCESGASAIASPGESQEHKHEREFQLPQHDQTVIEASHAPRMLQEIWLMPRNAAIAFMLGYRKAISPLYGQVCKYYPSCSRYAVEALQRQGLLGGVVLTVWRLLRCNPFSSGGIDDAPMRQRRRFIISEQGFVRPVKGKA